MARIYEYGKRGDRDRFPFRTLRLAGWAMLILGIIVFILGIVDVGWTAGNYTRNNCNTNTWKASLTKPCDSTSEVDDLIWTWVSAPIWASFFVIITGIVGTRFSSWNTDNLRFHRDMFTVMCVLVCLLWGPAVIVLSALEINYGMNIFYAIANNSLELQDTAKFVLPIMNAILIFFAWIAAIVGVCIGCCCAPVQDIDEYDSLPRRAPARTTRSAPGRDRAMLPYGGSMIGPPIMLGGGGYGGGDGGYGGGYGGASYPTAQASYPAAQSSYPVASQAGYSSPYGYYGGAYGGANYGAQAYASPYAGYASYGGASASPYF